MEVIDADRVRRSKSLDGYRASFRDCAAVSLILFGATWTFIGGLGHDTYGTGACALVHYETTILCVM